MIEVDNLAYTYAKAGKAAIEGLSFNIERGEILGFLGPSGAGKSTTQKVLIGLLKDYQGTISVFGKDLGHWKSDYYERVGVSFEFPNHYLKLTGIENLTYFGSLYKGNTLSPQTLLDLVDLSEDGGKLVSQYSKGMKNRLSVARSLLHNPELIFMDEPTAGQDPANARRIKELIRAQKESGKTVFLTTHDMKVAEELCDRVVFIVHGKIKLIDTPRELELRYGERKVRVEYQTGNGPEHRDFPLEGLGDNAGFLHLMRSDNIQTIHTQEATLEDIFIQVTGQSLA